MYEEQRLAPRMPMCKLAEYMVTPGSVRRRGLVKGQLKFALKGSLDESRKWRWWYQEARAEFVKFLRNPSAPRTSLSNASLELREFAGREAKDSRRDSLLGSAL